MIDNIVAEAPYFLLIAVRCLALILLLPLLSVRSVPNMAKVALAGYMAYLVLPHVNMSHYASFISPTGNFTISYILILIGEALIGIITGFYVSIIFSAFSTAGQFFAFQMGFSASSVYDSLSQVENPLVGQFLNFIALLVFMQNSWFQKLFVYGLVGSFSSINAVSLAASQNSVVLFLMRSLTELFSDALVISLPIMGTLVLINVSMGILGKAAPAMNLLSEGFPTMILLSFFLLTWLMPSFIDFFVRSFNIGIEAVFNLFNGIGIGLGGAGVSGAAAINMAGGV